MADFSNALPSHLSLFAFMRLTFLGTSSSRGMPRDGHTDALCTDALIPGSKSRRGRSSVLIEQDKANILIDATPDFVEQISREKVSRISTVFLTHAHGDASGGLQQLGAWIHKQNHQPIPLYGHPSTIEAVRARIPNNIIPRPTKPFASLNVSGEKIVCLPVNHGVYHIATFGYLFPKKLFYASDMDGTPAKTIALIKGTPTLILDGTFWERQIIRGHFTTIQSIEFAKKVKPRRLILTQLGHTHPPHAEAVRLLSKIVKKQKCTFLVQLAYDGLKIKI